MPDDGDVDTLKGLRHRLLDGTDNSCLGICSRRDFGKQRAPAAECRL
jgi:hypothetical protein